jgi:hypothetical protein
MEKCIYNNKVLVNGPNTSTYKIDTNKIDKLDDLFVIKGDKIAYKEPDLYILEKKGSQCNNTTEQWQKWFTTSYYYLGNKDGRRKIDENAKTRQINLCYKECSNNSILNKDEICENVETFEKGKYNNYLPYDPLAIICILGSHSNNIINHSNILKTTGTSNIYDGNHIPEGNYYHTIKNAKIDNDNLKINENIRNNILTDIKVQTIKSVTNTSNSPLKIIIDDTTKAYNILEKYIEDTFHNEEQNELNIKTIIKNEVNKFYILFDKRDELYINYLKKLKDGTRYKRIEYVKNVAEIIKNIEGFNISTMIPNSTADNENKKKYYLNYLFQYCVYIYFDKKNIIPNRFLNFGIYEKNYLLTDRANPDIAIVSLNIKPEVKTYNPISVKIETKEKNMFDEYLNVYGLYISFITTYPIILIAILILFMIIYILHLFNIIYYLTFVINYIYLIIIWLIYILIIAICCNSWIIGGITYSIAAIYNTSKSLYTFVSYVLYFLKYFIIIYLIYLVITNQINYIYDLIMFMVDTIVVIGYSLLISAYNIIFNTNIESIFIKIFIIYVIIMSYIFYKVWFNFDIDMILNIEPTTSTNDNTTSTNDNTTSTNDNTTSTNSIKPISDPISEHRNINTILYSDSVDAADIALQRVNLYKYKYFINLYEGAYKFYTDKVSDLDKERRNNYKINPKEIDNEKYIGHIIEIEENRKAIAQNNIIKLNEFEKNIEDEKTAKKEKRDAEEELQKTRDKLKELKIEKLKNTFNKENKSFIEKEIEMVKEKEKEDKQELDKIKEETERLRKLLQKN